MKDSIGSSKVDYACIALSRFVLSNSLITMILFKYEKALCSLCKGKKASYDSFYEDEWFLDSGASTYFTPFESDFANMTLGNYGWVEIANLKALLFIVASGTILIEHEIFDPEKGTIKVAVSKL